MTGRLSLPAWTIALPIAGLIALVVDAAHRGTVGLAIAAVVLIGAVVAAVHHAEVVAHRVGEPFGTLVLAIAVTVIEVSLILSLMTAKGGQGTEALARDTVFAAVMLILNGIVGLCLLVGGLRHREQDFTLDGVAAALCTLAALATLALVLPNYVTSAAGPLYAPPQLVFVAVVSVALYLTFVLVQTVRHRDYFLPAAAETPDDHAEAPSNAITGASVALLGVALVAVVFLAKGLSPAIEGGVAALGLPHATVGIVIAALVLAPEGMAAVRAARADRLQTSLNLALGSALATIGLTIPTVAIASLALGLPLALGVGAKEVVILTLSLFCASVVLGTGRTTVMGGAVHLVILAAYLFTAAVP